MILLIIRLKNGNSVSGRYTWQNALSTLRFAAEQADFVGFDMEDAV